MPGRKVKVARVSDIPEGRGRPFDLGEVVVAVFHLDDGFHAIDNTCPHRGASLAHGTIVDGRRISCPLHNWEFDIPTGCMWKSPGVATFPVTIEGEEIWVEV